jgi:hypothetical protein
MICWTLRGRASRWLAPGVAICLVAGGWLLTLPNGLPGDGEPPAFGPLSQDQPITALAVTAGIRLEKPAQLHRFSPKKTEAGGRTPRSGVIQTVRRPALRRQPLWDLPRRHLFAVRTLPRSSDDSADPLPS